MMRHEATGESMPLESSEMTLPAVPTGSPPTPGMLEALTKADYRAVATKVAAIGVPNRPGGLAELLETLDSLKQNIEYGYCFSLGDDMAVDVLKIRGAEQNSEAAKALAAAGFKLLSQEDIA